MVKKVERVGTEEENKLVTMEGKVRDKRLLYMNVDGLVSKKLELKDLYKGRGRTV